MNGKLGSLFKIGDYHGLAKLIIRYKKNKKTFQKKTEKAFIMLNRFKFEKKIATNIYLSLISIFKKIKLININFEYLLSKHLSNKVLSYQKSFDQLIYCKI